MKILMVGGAVYLGGRIALEAKRAGHSIVALVRESSEASLLE
jgi:putative NADH-flavin reductase